VGYHWHKRGEACRKPHHPFSLCLSLRTEEKKPLSPRTLPRRPYKVLLATLTSLYQQLDQSEKPGGFGSWELSLSSNFSLGRSVGS
jgi:hypothetical protein